MHALNYQAQGDPSLMQKVGVTSLVLLTETAHTNL